MFEGSAEDLKQTRVTQSTIFLHSVILAKILGENFKPYMVAGHSLIESSREELDVAIENTVLMIQIVPSIKMLQEKQ